MRHRRWVVPATLAAIAASGSVTSYGGGGRGGPSGQIIVGNDLFRSAHNGTPNLAVDTVDYDCLVHGAAMRGRIVVRDSTQ